MKVLLLIAIILGVFNPMEAQLVTQYKVPTNYAAGDWAKFWESLSKCASRIPDPFLIPIPIPINIVKLIDMIDPNQIHLTGIFNVKNIKISQFTKAVNNKETYAMENLEFDYTVPIALEFDYATTNVVLLNVIPLKGKGHVTIKLNLRAFGKLSYDDSGNKITVTFDEKEGLQTLSEPLVNITGLQDDERMSELTSRQLTGILDEIFKTIRKILDYIITILCADACEGASLEQLIETVMTLLFTFIDSKDIIEAIDKCQTFEWPKNM